jgi:hypothetical protein
MCPNEVFKVVNMAIPLVIFVCSDGNDLMYLHVIYLFIFMQVSPFYPQLDVGNYQIDLQILHAWTS